MRIRWEYWIQSKYDVWSLVVPVLFPICLTPEKKFGTAELSATSNFTGDGGLLVEHLVSSHE